MKRNILNVLKLSVFGAAMSLMAVAQAEKKPNIIFILADDLGYGDLSCLNPDSKIHTPVLDKMAANGMIFTDAHTSSSVCTPSRYSIMTGRYNWRSTLKRHVLSGYSPALIPSDRTTMASMLKASGYDTAFIGKWHLGWDWALQDAATVQASEAAKTAKNAKAAKNTKKTKVKNAKTEAKHKNPNVDFSKPITNSPMDNGFDYFYGICGSLDMPPYVYVENNMPTDTSNNMEIKTGGRSGPQGSDLVFDQVMTNLVDRSCAYVKQQAKSEKPFFLYLPITGPHTPIVPSADFKGKSGLNAYADFVIEIDTLLARLFDTLEAEGIDGNTIVVFTSDNGCSPAANMEELQKKGHFPSYDMRGNKADLFEGGHRVPCLVMWKDKFGKTVANQTICLTDFFATFAGIAGYEIKDNEGEDSVNLMSIFENSSEAKQVRESTIHHSIDGNFAIRMGDWKLLVSPSSGGWSYPHPKKDSAAVAKLPKLQLYNLKTDKAEKNNLIKENPEIAKELLAQLRKEIKDGRSTEGEKQSNEVNGEWTQLKDVNKNYF